MPTEAATKQREARYLTRPIELREAGGTTELPVVRGYAAVFNVTTDTGWGFREKVLPGAFAESLARGDDIVALVDHRMDRIVARSGGTLKVGEDGVGLWYEFTPANTQEGRDLVENIRAKNIRGSSFGFFADEESWDWKPADGGDEVRTLVKVTLVDVSPVVFPAYPTADVSLRSYYDGRKKAKPEVKPTAPSLATRTRVAMMG